MCSHYQAVAALERFERHFRTAPPPVAVRGDMWPTYAAPVVVSHSNQRQAIMARWGLIAASAKAINPKLSAFNARSESAATSPTFGGAWAQGQRCIVPAEAVYEPDWRSGRHVPTRLQRADGLPMGLAGLWDSWVAPGGELVQSFTMLTINAAAHPLMMNLHKPQDEKRMVVILNESDYDAWLNADSSNGSASDSANIAHLLTPYPADRVAAISEPSQAIQNNPGLF